VGHSGIHEWIYYEPQLDMLITPLLFSQAGTKEREKLKATGIAPSILYPRGILYPELKKMNVASYSFGSHEYMPSTYSKVVMDGANLRSFKTLSEAFINIGLLLEKQTMPTYIHLYFDKIDAVAHEYGPTAPQTEAEAETFLLMLENYMGRIFKAKKRVLFLMTADHGSVEVDPKTTIYLNRDPRFKGIEEFIKPNRSRQLLIPAGSARDMFLYIKDEMLDEAQAFLAKRLEGKADVVKTELMMTDGYFGAEISTRFRERVGNLIILPYRYESVWWYEKDKFEMKFHGHHGGLTSQEMETILYSYEI
jgi:predicted AlkP superfamily pyrophosphatase or phosphodiesterase